MVCTDLCSVAKGEAGNWSRRSSELDFEVDVAEVMLLSTSQL